MFVFRFLPVDLVDRITRWDELKRWDRREIGQDLRRLGLSYKEIAAAIPVHKGTLSGWCRDLDIPNADRARIGTRRAVGAKMRQQTLERYREIRDQGRIEGEALINDPFFVAGVTAYWAEGSKRSKDVSFANSDPALIRLFINWAEHFIGVSRSDFTVKLHLHSGQIDDERQRYWSDVTGIPLANFRKTFVKPEGTGHRKNILYNGTASVRIPRSSALLHRILGWSDAVAEQYASLR